jgi:hypothetical protein
MTTGITQNIEIGVTKGFRLQIRRRTTILRGIVALGLHDRLLPVFPTLVLAAAAVVVAVGCW